MEGKLNSWAVTLAQATASCERTQEARSARVVLRDFSQPVQIAFPAPYQSACSKSDLRRRKNPAATAHSPTRLDAALQCSDHRFGGQLSQPCSLPGLGLLSHRACDPNADVSTFDQRLRRDTFSKEFGRTPCPSGGISAQLEASWVDRGRGSASLYQDGERLGILRSQKSRCTSP